MREIFFNQLFTFRPSKLNRWGYMPAQMNKSLYSWNYIIYDKILTKSARQHVILYYCQTLVLYRCFQKSNCNELHSRFFHHSSKIRDSSKTPRRFIRWILATKSSVPSFYCWYNNWAWLHLGMDINSLIYSWVSSDDAQSEYRVITTARIISDLSYGHWCRE